jgi:hypothetical protein
MASLKAYGDGDTVCSGLCGRPQSHQVESEDNLYENVGNGALRSQESSASLLAEAKEGRFTISSPKRASHRMGFDNNWKIKLQEHVFLEFPL